MISRSAEVPVVAFSVRVYQTLLNAYPRKFQLEYGQDMVQVFRDCCLRTIRQGGSNGMARLWAVTLLDLLQSVVSEHRQKETEMKKEMKPQDIRMAGWALILGGIALALSLLVAIQLDGSWDDRNWFVLTIILTFLSLPLLAVGMLGLRSRYGNQVGTFGKNMLLIGAILGPVTSVIGFSLQGISDFWTLIFIGPTILFACLVLFGLVGLYRKPLPRWNVLPILAGLWLSIRWFLFMIPPLITGDWPADDTLNIADAVFTPLQIASLVALGYILKSDMPEEMVAVT